MGLLQGVVQGLVWSPAAAALLRTCPFKGLEVPKLVPSQPGAPVRKTLNLSPGGMLGFPAGMFPQLPEP